MSENFEESASFGTGEKPTAAERGLATPHRIEEPEGFSDFASVTVRFHEFSD
jgi:hypothetical protein